MHQNGVCDTLGEVLKKKFFGENLLVKIFDFFPNNIYAQKHLGKILVENIFLQNDSGCTKTVFVTPWEKF